MGDVILWVWLIGLPITGLLSIVPWRRYIESDFGGPAETYAEAVLFWVIALLCGLMTGGLWPIAALYLFGWIRWQARHPAHNRRKYDYDDDHIGTVRMTK